MEKWIIIIAILVVARIVYSIIKKKNRKKKLALKEEAEKELQEKARIIDIYEKKLSVNKVHISHDKNRAIVAKFEYDWSENSPYFYNLQIEKKPLKILTTFLISRKECLGLFQYDATSYAEIMSYSRLFLQSFIDKAAKDHTIEYVVDFWHNLLSCNYGKYDGDKDRADFDLYSEMIFEDLKSIDDSDILLEKIEAILPHFLSTYLRNKLLNSEHYKNLVLDTEKRRKEKLLTELEAFKSKGVIDKEFISYVKNHHDEKEQFIIREAFDEVAFKEVMSKFFPGQSYSKIKPEFLTVLAQAYSGFTLKLLE